MVDTLDNIDLPANQWVDLYVATGIVVGTQIIVQNLGAGSGIYLHTSELEPVGDDGYTLVIRGTSFSNDAADAGAWAFSPNHDGKVHVRVA